MTRKGPTMARTWRMIRVPADLAERLDRVCREAETSHTLMRSALPNEYCEHCPHHYVIMQALDELEGHRDRARRPTRARGRNIAVNKSVHPG